MTDITLTPDELAEAIALPPGETMTLKRAFDPQPPDGFEYTGFLCRPECFWFKARSGLRLDVACKSPLG